MSLFRTSRGLGRVISMLVTDGVFLSIRSKMMALRRLVDIWICLALYTYLVALDVSHRGFV